MDEKTALEWIADVFAVKGRPLYMDDDRLSIPEWDSMGILLLLSRLQEDHGILLSADEVANIGTVREIYDLLLSKAKAPADPDAISAGRQNP